MLSPTQQAVDLIQKNKNVLIALPENLNGDSLGCALALESALKTLGKKAEIVSPGLIPEKLEFLAKPENLKNQISSLRDFIVSIDTTQNKISRLRYEKENNILKIFLATEQKIEERDIKLESGSFYYDLIISLDAPDLESLGKIFGENTELFYGKPILNIDHKAGNEYFGEVNLVETTAAACAEIVQGLIENLGPNLINPASATALLAGLISKTHSFQNTKTTPKALSLASVLITKGAEQEKIIQHLYKIIPLNRLRLWGRLLSQMEFDQQKNVVWLQASRQDFSATATSPRDLPAILEEIENLFPQISLSFIFWNDETSAVWAISQAKQPEILQKLNSELNGTLKNDRLLIKFDGLDINSAKERMDDLLNPMG